MPYLLDMAHEAHLNPDPYLYEQGYHGHARYPVLHTGAAQLVNHRGDPTPQGNLTGNGFGGFSQHTPNGVFSAYQIAAPPSNLQNRAAHRLAPAPFDPELEKAPGDFIVKLDNNTYEELKAFLTEQRKTFHWFHSNLTCDRHGLTPAGYLEYIKFPPVAGIGVLSALGTQDRRRATYLHNSTARGLAHRFKPLLTRTWHASQGGQHRALRQRAPKEEQEKEEQEGECRHETGVPASHTQQPAAAVDRRPAR